MKKLVIVAAVILAIVLLALPRAVGSMTEARVRERVAAIDASSAASAEVKSFERGWFKSTAKIDLMLVPDDFVQLAAASPATGNPFLGGAPLPIAVEFAHGPIALLDGVHFGWSKMIARVDSDAPGVQELLQTLGVPYLFEFRGRTGYGGGLAFDADAPAFELPVDETTFRFSGAQLDGSFAGRTLEADATVGAFEFASPGALFALGNIHATADNELLSEYVMPGQATLSIGSVTITDTLSGTMPTFEAANLRFTSDTTLDSTGALLDMRVDYEAETIRVEDNELTAATLGVAMRNLDVAALEAYSDAIGTAAPAADAVTILESLGPELERALRAGPSVTLDPIRFRFADEPFEGRLELATNTARLPPAGALNLENPLLVLGLFDTNADMRVSKPLAQQLATLAAQLQLGSDDSIPPDQVEYMAEAQAGLMLTMLTGQGVLIEDDEGYRTRFEFTNGEITLNGNPLPFGLR